MYEYETYKFRLDSKNQEVNDGEDIYSRYLAGDVFTTRSSEQVYNSSSTLVRNQSVSNTSKKCISSIAVPRKKHYKKSKLKNVYKKFKSMK